MDTSGLFAALVHNDNLHGDAKGTMARLLGEEFTLHMTSYELLETSALLQTRVSLEAARQVERVIRPLLEVTWIDEQLLSCVVQRIAIVWYEAGSGMRILLGISRSSSVHPRKAQYGILTSRCKRRRGAAHYGKG